MSDRITLRIASLVPSVTETLLSWGVTPSAVTRFCEHPELPTVGGTKDPDVAAIVGLHPDLVVMCDEENRIEDATALEDAGVAIHVVRIRELADVEPQLDLLRQRIGLAALDPPVSVGPNRPAVTATAFIPIWRQRRADGGASYHTLNRHTYGSSLLAAAGVGNVFDDLHDRYAEVRAAEARTRNPDIVVAPSEPYPFAERHRAELSEIAPVVFVDGQDLFWWGARTPGALRRLSDALAAR